MFANVELFTNMELFLKGIFGTLSLMLAFLVPAYFFYKKGSYCKELKSVRKLINDLHDGKIEDPLKVLVFFHLQWWRRSNIRIVEWIGDKCITKLYNLLAWGYFLVCAACIFMVFLIGLFGLFSLTSILLEI